MASISSICILRLSAIGDTCNAVSVVQSIQGNYPDARITWIIGKTEAALLNGLPGIELVVFDKNAGLSAYRKLRQDLAGRTFDVLLLMQLAFRANVASLCISAKRRIGYDKARSKELHSLFINERIAPATKPHVLDTFRQFLTALDIPLTPPQWNIPVAPDDELWARAQLDSDSKKHVVLVPAASAQERNWLPERYAQVVNHAHSKGFSVYLCGGPAHPEVELANRVASLCDAPVHNLVGKSSLKQLFALIKNVSLVIAPDTGPIHMAVAAGTPVIGLYAHSNPARTGPYGQQQNTIDAYTPLLREKLGSDAPNAPWGRRLKGDDLMSHISVQQVCDMFDRLTRGQAK
ncbi:glycosyl transferase [Streptosporangium jomthongense]|uniref:Glycosyltransferase family 9 protein n=1 Tax=Marinobacter aromaticivorans TaxID=1494078 RepID=A0ABW2IYP3_9GAMM|nr:glycosyltransferase family 9 protein [Marinobacter aromaticivorans]GGE74745.1 glycosyl transferase [Streptosporangium jomthongense]